TPALNASATGPIQYTPSPAGPHSVTATYNGDAHFLVSTSGALAQSVSKANTSTTLAAQVSGSTVTLTATVAVTAPGAGSPTGTVQFFNGATSLGTVALSGQFTAAVNANLSVLSGALTAVYSGDGNFNGSTAGGITATVTAITVA